MADREDRQLTDGDAAERVNPAPPDPRVPGFAQMLGYMVLFLILTLVVTMVGGVVYALLAFVFGWEFPGTAFGNPQFLIWVTVVANTAAAAVCLLLGKVSARRPWSEILPFRPVRPALLSALALFGSGLTILLSDVDNLVRYFLPMPEFMMQMMSDMIQGGFSSFLLLVLVAPWTEELLFRGFVFNGFLKRYRPANAVFLSALGFAILHLNPYQFVGGLVIGIFLGWLRLRTGSLWPCLFLHALNNAFVFFWILMPFTIPGCTVQSEHHFQPWWFDLLGLALFAAGLYAVRRQLATRFRTDSRAPRSAW